VVADLQARGERGREEGQLAGAPQRQQQEAERLIGRRGRHAAVQDARPAAGAAAPRSASLSMAPR